LATLKLGQSKYKQQGIEKLSKDKGFPMMFLLPCTAYQPYPAQFPNLNAGALNAVAGEKRWAERKRRERRERYGDGVYLSIVCCERW
jgi:hypothetical protein